MSSISLDVDLVFHFYRKSCLTAAAADDNV